MLTPKLEDLLALRTRAFPLAFSSSRRRQTLLSGLYASVFRGQGLEFEEVREYREGDDIRHIDWRVTARMNKPYLKVYREERERRVILCVDMGAHMQFGTRNTFKSIQAAYLAALLGWSAHGHGDRVGGLLFGGEQPHFFRPQRSSRTFGQFLRYLTQVSHSGQSQAGALEQALKFLTQTSATGALLFIIADFNQTSIALLKRALSQLHQRHEIVLISIDDPADYDLPAIGTVSFIAPNGQQAEINTNNLTGQATYRQAWHDHRQALQQIAKHLYSDFFSLSTQDDVYRSLISNLQQRAQQQKKHR